MQKHLLINRQASDKTNKRVFPSHIPALDGLRGLAVIAVVVFHLAPYAQSANDANAVLAFFRFGWVGVDLFFVLSGFLITGILYENRHGRSRFRGFYGRRLLRIAPLYYLALVIYAGVAPLIASPEQAAALYQSLPWHSAYLTNIRIALSGGWAAAPMNTGHLWSLAVEEQFYLLWPFVIAAAVRWARSPRVALMCVCATLIVICIAFRLWMLTHFAYGAYTLLPARMDALAVGGFVALWARGPQGASDALAASKPVLLVSGIALLLLAIPSAGLFSYMNPFQQGVGYTLWAALFGAVLIRAASYPRGRLSAILTIKPLLAAGRISYGLYLIHFLVMYVLDKAGGRSLGFVGFCLAVVTISVALSHLSWRYFETPLLRLKHHFSYDGVAKSRPRLRQVTATA